MSEPIDEFTCTMCRKVFAGAWSDEEAMAEAREVFGAYIVDLAAACDELDVVCDDCFEKVRPR